MDGTEIVNQPLPCVKWWETKPPVLQPLDIGCYHKWIGLIQKIEMEELLCLGEEWWTETGWQISCYREFRQDLCGATDKLSKHPLDATEKQEFCHSLLFPFAIKQSTLLYQISIGQNLWISDFAVIYFYILRGTCYSESARVYSSWLTAVATEKQLKVYCLCCSTSLLPLEHCVNVLIYTLWDIYLQASICSGYNIQATAFASA